MNAPRRRSAHDVGEALERRLASLLRELPLRPAPRTLQARVLAELARRAALPWWQRSFRHWPVPVRAAFVAVCAALIGLTLLAGTRLLLPAPGIAATGAWALSWAGHLQALGRASTDLAASLGRALPLTWLYGALGLALGLYAVLFMLGATAYRMLRLRENRS